MPIPGYIIAASSGAIDGPTNRVSFFNVIETLEAVEVPTPQSRSSPAAPGTVLNDLRVFVLAMWIRGDDDAPDQEFEIDLICKTESGKVVFEAVPQRFTFRTPVYRLVVHETPLPGLPGLGVCTVESRVRRASEQEWSHSVKCSFVVREKVVSPPEGMAGAQFSAD